MNLNQFKVFVVVYETGSMTAAAERLHLTQSGISQHIKSLESDLGLSLFARVGRKLIPTDAAEQIYPDVAEAFARVSDRIARVTGKKPVVEGIVRLGMPYEFGRNVLIPKLTEVGLKYPGITFEIVLDYASVVNQMILEGKLDLAYIDESPLDRRLTFKPVATEDLLLCGSREYVSRKPRVKYAQSYFESLEYIEYKGSEPILRRWMLHHLKRRNFKLNVRAHIMDTQGVAKFITCGLGVGVLPGHLVSRLKAEGVDLYVFEGKANKPLHNEIRVVRLAGRELSPAVQATLDSL